MELEAMVQEEFNVHIVFRVKENLFSVNGLDVLTILQMPQKLINIPHAPDYIRGSFRNLEDIVSVVDLRRFFDWTTIEQEYESFVQMIDQRKWDHMNWVETLKMCRRTGEPFHLAKDCHQCALGKWRDNYHTELVSINRLLNELDVPHGELHALADTVLSGTEETESVLERMDSELVPSVLELLDTMKQEFRDREFREMVVLLRGDAHIALTVDEVLGVESLPRKSLGNAPLMRRESTYVRAVRERNDSELVMELDIPLLMADIQLCDPNKL